MPMMTMHNATTRRDKINETYSADELEDRIKHLLFSHVKITHIA